MENYIEFYNSLPYLHARFLDYFIKLVVENFVIKRITDFESIPIKDLCHHLDKFKPYNQGSFYIHFRKKELEQLIEICSDALQYETVRETICKQTENFYFKNLADAFNLRTYSYNEKFDEYGLPIEISPVLKDYILKLHDTFQSIVNTKIERDFNIRLPMRLQAKTTNYTENGISHALKNIIFGKQHKGVDYYDLLLFRVKPYKRITQMLLINKSFLRLCSYNERKIILKEDSIDSFNFRVAVLDLIKFIDAENKVYFDTKIEQCRHNVISDIIEAALIAEIDKKFMLK